MKVQTEYGRCEWSIEADYVHIYNLHVEAKYRRQGNCEPLLRKAISEIRATGHTGEIAIVTDIPHLANFYARLGLEVYDFYSGVTDIDFEKFEESIVHALAWAK